MTVVLIIWFIRDFSEFILLLILGLTLEVQIKVNLNAE